LSPVTFGVCDALPFAQQSRHQKTAKLTAMTALSRHHHKQYRELVDNSSNTLKMSSSPNSDPSVKKVSKTKALYLLTDDGFLKKLLFNLTSISLVIMATLSTSLFRTPAMKLYNAIMDKMLDIAHRNAWWFLLATLSSSCCYLQLLLNALSVGCAGFNTVLGPVRPTLLAIGILSQGMSWYVALRVVRRPQWTLMAGSSIMMITLSLLPEILDFYTKWKMRTNGVDETGSENGDTVRIVFDMGTSVGCAACVKSISGILDAIPTVAGYNVSVDDNRLNVRCKKGTDAATILDNLKDGGFSMESIL